MPADQVAAPGARDRLKESQQLCKNEEDAVPTSDAKVIELCREVLDTKRYNA